MSDKKTTAKIGELEVSELTTPKIIDYRLVQSGIPDTLAEKVQYMIDQGWVPFGNLVVNGYVLMQPMVKYDD